MKEVGKMTLSEALEYCEEMFCEDDEEQYLWERLSITYGFEDITFSQWCEIVLQFNDKKVDKNKFINIMRNEV